MCSRYAFLLRLKRLIALLKSLEGVEADLPPRYNIAPTQDAPIIRSNPTRGTPEVAMLRWGLVPSWATDPSVGSRNINARSETAAEKPSFRDSLRTRRCIVPMSGFYEWRQPSVASGRKQPFYITRADDEPLLIAGLWDRWSQGPLETFTILTTEPNDFIRPLHGRMPVILHEAALDLWMSRRALRESEFSELCKPPANDQLVARPVAPLINSPKNEGPDLIAAVAEHDDGLLF